MFAACERSYVQSRHPNRTVFVRIPVMLCQKTFRPKSSQSRASSARILHETLGKKNGGHVTAWLSVLDHVLTTLWIAQHDLVNRFIGKTIVFHVVGVASSSSDNDVPVAFRQLDLRKNVTGHKSVDSRAAGGHIWRHRLRSGCPDGAGTYHTRYRHRSTTAKTLLSARMPRSYWGTSKTRICMFGT